MPTFPAPVTINDSSNSAATIIGRGITGAPINPASVIEASAVLLYGNPGLSGGPIRLSLIGEPGIVDVVGDGNTRILLDSSGQLSITGGQISIGDSTESTRFTVDSSGRLTLTDSNGNTRILLDSSGQLSITGGQISIGDSTESTRFTVDSSGRLTLTDSNGNTRILLDSRGQIRITDEQISINDSAESTRFTADSSGRLTLVDSTGTQSILLDPETGSIRFSSTQDFPSSIQLDVSGRITLSDSLGGITVLAGDGHTSFGGNMNVGGNLTVNGDVFLPGADCAEHFDTADTQILEPGTVVVLDGKGALQESRLAYDRKVAGIVSGAGEHRPAIILDRRPLAGARTALAPKPPRSRPTTNFSTGFASAARW